MKRTNVVIDSNKAGAIISEASEDQKRYFDDLVDGMKATINDKFADIDSSIQKVQASLSENKALVMKNYLNIGESVLEIRTLLAEKKERPTINWNLKQGVLQSTFNIDDVSTADAVAKSLSSTTTYCAGADWWLSVRKALSGQYLQASLHHKADSDNISYEPNVTIRLLGSSENNEIKFSKCFTNKTPAWGFPSFILWSKLVNFSNGFVNEKGNFKMEVTFSVANNATNCVLPDTQFLTCSFVESDCTLLVEDRRFSVNKGLLSAFSSYFKTLFFGEFRERDQDEIELKEVCAEEFLHLLKVLYPPFNDDDIDSKNVEGLLRLADRYQVKAVSHRCSQYLKKCALSEVSLGEKMLHAQNYHLSELVEHCIKEECKTVDDVKKLRATSHYSLLDKDIKLQIHENIT